MKHENLLKSYGLFDAKVPRFTSYPPANKFSDAVGINQVQRWRQQIPKDANISLYVHIPFCRHICWFCACRTQGLKTDAPLGKYVDRVLSEARALRSDFPKHIAVKRLHLGGGTPTILPDHLLDHLLSGLKDIFDFSMIEEFSAEIDPTDVDQPRLEALAHHGLSRASFGIQDFDPSVQKAIGRIQSKTITENVVTMARDLGVTGINFDLLYGLPYQTSDSLYRTLQQAMELGPYRFAVFGYAHVPWMSKRQVMISENTLPSPEKRFTLFQKAQKTLLQNGHLQIGIDHFAKPHDGLAKAFLNGTLRRSFQGYTDDCAEYLIALGASGISKYPQGYAQNNPATGAYSLCIDANKSPISRGFDLSDHHLKTAHFIEALLCYHKSPLSLAPKDIQRHITSLIYKFRDAMVVENETVVIKKWAHPLVRIIASDLTQSQIDTEVRFSQAI